MTNYWRTTGICGFSYSLQKSTLQKAPMVLRHEEPEAAVGVLQYSPVWLSDLYEFPLISSNLDFFFLNPKHIPMFCLQPHLRPHQLTHGQVTSPPDTPQAFTSWATFNLFLSFSTRLNLWSPLQEEADEDCWWNRCHSGIPPMGGCHLLAKQGQGERFPMWRESDLGMLGLDSCPLLSWWVGSDAAHWFLANAESASLMALWTCVSDPTKRAAASLWFWGRTPWMRVILQWSKRSRWKKSSSTKGSTTVRAITTMTSVWPCLPEVHLWTSGLEKQRFPWLLSCSPCEAEGQTWEVCRGEHCCRNSLPAAASAPSPAWSHLWDLWIREGETRYMLHGNTHYNNARKYFSHVLPHTNQTNVLPVIKYPFVPLKEFCGFIPLFLWHRLVVQFSVSARSSGEHPCWWCVSTWGLLCKQDHR